MNETQTKTQTIRLAPNTKYAVSFTKPFSDYDRKRIERELRAQIDNGALELQVPEGVSVVKVNVEQD
jgi:hypothetical protein